MTKPEKPLDAEQIKANPATSLVGRKVLVLDSATSTNDVAAGYAGSLENDGLVVFAEEQSAGRGRMGAQWRGGRGLSILCSVLLTRCHCQGELLSLAVAVAVAEAIGRCGTGQAMIKWPNDIVIGGRKVAGILLESKTVFPSGRTAFIVGIGVNCHHFDDSFSEDLRARATSIDMESGSRCNRVLVARAIISSLDIWIAKAAIDSRRVVERWKSLSVLLGTRVTLACDGTHFVGNCIGVDPRKGLILQLDTGAVRMFDAAHTRIV